MRKYFCFDFWSDDEGEYVYIPCGTNSFLRIVSRGTTRCYFEMFYVEHLFLMRELFYYNYE